MTPNETTYLPHHTLKAYGVAKRLVIAVRDAQLRDANLKSQALRAAQSAALNCAEGAGRGTRADKARCYTIARAEAGEAQASVEIAALCGTCSTQAEAAVTAIAVELVRMLNPLCR